MKKWFHILLCGAMLLTMAACGAAEETVAAPPAPEGVTFTDDLGRELTVAPPERTAVLIGSFADIWCLAGGNETLVAAADDTWTSFDLDLGPEVANLGGVKETNMEALLAADPDLVLASSNTAANVELLENFEKMEIPVAYFNVSSFDDYLRMLDICTRLTGHTENYQTYGTEVQAQVEAAKERVTGQAPTVLYVRATGVSCKVKNSWDSVLGEMLAELGCINIADSEDSLLENLSMETIVAADPDFIFAVLQGSDTGPAQAMLEAELLSNPAWNGLTAVREGRYHIMDSRLYNLKPNARWGEAYEKLADILYPADK